MADVFASPEFADHEQVVFCADAASGLRAIIAIHDTRLGPALGGCRMWPYPDETAAARDVLRLSRAMTYKAAMAGVPHGGGKTVIIGDSRKHKTRALLLALGDALDRLSGRYFAAEDVGTLPADMDVIAERTRQVVGTTASGVGDPSPATAYGVFLGLRAAVAHGMKRDSLDGVRVAVQGLGSVGGKLCRHLYEAGAELIVADLNGKRAAETAHAYAATVSDPEGIVAADADVFAPCALGAGLNDETIPRLRCKVVAGAANNQLLEPRHGEALRRRGILYTPDYVLNAGGLIYLADAGRPGGFHRERAMAAVAAIPRTLGEVFVRAEREGAATSAVADRIAEERLAAVGDKRLKGALGTGQAVLG